MEEILEKKDKKLEVRKNSFYKREQCKLSAQVESFAGKLRKKLNHDRIQAKRNQTMEVNGDMRGHELGTIWNSEDYLLA